jgi:hypothetical protein
MFGRAQSHTAAAAAAALHMLGHDGIASPASAISQTVKENSMNDSDLRPTVWIGHVVLETDRLEDSTQFMKKIGMRPIYQGNDVAILELRGGTHLILRRNSTVVPGAAPFDLMVDDLESSHASFAALGLKPTPIEAMPSVSHEVFKIEDPAGHVISVFSNHVEGRPV